MGVADADGPGGPREDDVRVAGEEAEGGLQEGDLPGRARGWGRRCLGVGPGIEAL